MGVVIDLGSLRHVATLSQVPAPPGTPDGDGGYTDTPTPLSPETWRCSIDRAASRPSVSRFSQTVIAQATHVLTGRFHSGIKAARTIITWVDRAGTTHTSRVLDEDDTEGLGVETVALVSEIIT